MDHEINDNGRNRSKAREGECEHYIDEPDVARIKEEGNAGLSARAQGIIGCENESREGGEERTHKYEEGCEVSYTVGCVIDKREDGCYRRFDKRDTDADGYGEGEQLFVFVLCLFEISCTESLTDDNSDRVSEGHIANAENVQDGYGDIKPCNNVKSAGGVALVSHSNRKRPKHLVHKHRHSLYRHLADESEGNAEGAVSSDDEGGALLVGVSPDDKNRKLGKSL